MFLRPREAGGTVNTGCLGAHPAHRGPVWITAPDRNAVLLTVQGARPMLGDTDYVTALKVLQQLIRNSGGTAA